MKYQLVHNVGQKIPVLDDYEGICNTIHPANITQPSQETEVSHQPLIQEFPKALNSFKAVTKQYRSFSGAIKFPPLDNNITLNSNKDVLVNNYHNARHIKHEIADSFDEEKKRKEKELAVKRIVERLKFVQSLTNYRPARQHEFQKRIDKSETKIEKFRHEKKEVKHVEEKKNIEILSSKHETVKKDLQNIKQTAFDIVDENIKRAVSVAEEIKREIDVEMTDKRKTVSEKKDIKRHDTIKSSDVKKAYVKKDTQTRDSSLKSLTKQSAFSLGLQTIPYMKSYMEANYFKTVIIKTLFLHLTKFLVSLSRYMLRQQTFNKKVHDYHQFKKESVDFDEKETEYNEERVLSGAEMSRKFGKTPIDFTDRMDQVIIEMEGKTGIERTSRSRSRSRSRVCESVTSSKWEDINVFKSSSTMDKLVKQFYIAYILYEGWSEYYDLGETKKSEEKWDSSMIKKETFEKLLEEKIVKEETPVTYVATVESHAYTNEDALLKASEQIEKIAIDKVSLESKKDSIIVEKKEQAAVCTDIQHHVIEIKKEEPMNREIIIESIEDITPVDEQKPFAVVEKGITGIAVQKTTEILEPVTEMKSEQIQLKQAHSTIERSNISIASSESIAIREERDQEFILPDMKPRKSITLIEPLKIVAETSEVATAEPRLEIIEIPEEPPQTLIPLVETPVKSIAQTTEVQINEIQTEPLQEFKSISESSKTIIEPISKPVAETVETFINQPKTEEIEFPSLKTEKPILLYEPLSKTIAETSIVKTDEANICSLVEKSPIAENIKSSIETSTKTVAQKMEMYVESAHVQDLDKIKIQEEHPNIVVEIPSQTVAITDETYLGEVSVELYGNAETITKNIQGNFERPIQAVAETFESRVHVDDLSTFEKLNIESENVAALVESPDKVVAEISQTFLSETSSDLFGTATTDIENTQNKIETPEKIVAELFETYVHDSSKEFDKFEVKGNKLQFVVEEPVKVIAETNETRSDEAVGVIEKLQIKQEKLKSDIETQLKTVALANITLTDESSGVFEKEKLQVENTSTLIEAPVKTVAESCETLLNEAGREFTEKPIATENTTVGIEVTFKTVANKIETQVDDGSLGIIEKVDMKTEIPKSLIDTNFKPVVEINESILNEESIAIEIPEIKTDITQTNIETSFMPVPEKFEVLVDKADIENFEIPECKTEKPKSTIVEPVQIVAESTLVVMDEPKPNILEVEDLKPKTPKMLMDDSLRFVAEAILPVIEEPRCDLDITKITKEEAKLELDNLEPTIITEVLPAEPNQEPFEAPEIKPKIPLTTIEEPLLPVAETLTTTTEGPKDDILSIPKVVEEHAKTHYKTTEHTMVTDILPLEPPCDLLEVPEIKRRHSRTLLEDVKLTAANTEINYPFGPKDDILLIPTVSNQKANLKVDELKAIETTVVKLEEEAQKSSAEFKVDAMKTKMFVEDYVQTVAQKSIVSAEESEKSFSDVSEAFTQSASVAVQSLAALAQTAVIPIEEVKTGATPSELSSHTAKVFVQEMAAADVSHVIALSSIKDESFEISKNIMKVDTTVESSNTVTAKISEIDVKEAVCEITEIEDDKGVYTEAEYSVELAHEEDVRQTVEASAELKIVKKREDISEAAVVNIQKDIEYMENGMASIIQSVEADLQASKISKKAHEKSIKFVAESKIIHGDSSKSPSPESPVIDVYFFKVDTPHERKREYSTEIQSAELDYKTAQKHRYTQAEASVAQSIGIQLHISDFDQSESEYTEIEYVDEVDYLKRQALKQTAMDFETVIVNQSVQSQVDSEHQISQTRKGQRKVKHRRSEAAVAQSIAVSGKQEEISMSAFQASGESTSMSQKVQRSHQESSISIGAKQQMSVSAFQGSQVEISQGYQSQEAASQSIAVSGKQTRSSALQSSEASLEVRQGLLSHEASIQDSSILQSMAVRAKQEHRSASAFQSSQESMEFSQAFQQTSVTESSSVHVDNVRKGTNIEELEMDTESLQKDISIMEMDIESRHAMLASAAKTSKSSKTRTEESSQESKSPSPPIQPPTPLTDEYVFRLVAPLQSREGTPVPRDCTDSSESEEEILKQKLIPHIELTIEQKIYDPPLPTPPTSPERKVKPFYSKPGLRGGGDDLDITKEEIIEIGRQSTLLASAIGETLQSIEQYKTEAGINTKDMEDLSSKTESSETSMEFREYKETEDNKVEVLIDKMIETSRRFSDELKDGEGSKSGDKEYVIPITQDTSVTDERKACEKEEFSTSCIRKEVNEGERKMDQNKLTDQLMKSVHGMVDPNATLEERLKQVQAQMAELARLPDIIQKTLEDVKVQFEQLNHQVQQKSVEIQMSQTMHTESHKQFQVSEQVFESKQEQEIQKPIIIEVTESTDNKKNEELFQPKEIVHSIEEDREIQNIIEKRRLEAESMHDEIMKERLSQELRMVRERLSPKPGFEGPSLALPQTYSPNLGLAERRSPNLGLAERRSPNLGLQERASPRPEGPPFAEARAVSPVKMWKKLDTYDDANLEQILNETLTAQAEVIQGKAIGVNFKKYEKPPPPLDHLQHSEVYKAIHDVDQKPLKKVELLKPAIAASDYVERLRSVSPSPAKTLIEDVEV